MAKEVLYKGEVRYKKASLNHFASKWNRFTIQGKSSKELKEYIEELRKVNKYLMRSVTALEYKKGVVTKEAKEIKRDSDKAVNKAISRTRMQERLVARENYRKSLREKETDLKSGIKIAEYTLENVKLENESLKALNGVYIKELDELRIKSDPAVRKEVANKYFIDLVDKWKDKYDEASARAKRNLQRKQRVKTVKQKVIVEVERKKTVSDVKADRLLKFIETPISDKVTNYSDITLKIISYLQDIDITVNDISVILKSNLLGNFTVKSSGIDYRKLASLEKRGYLSRGNTGIVTKADYWFLNTEGKNVVKKLMNYISHGKTKIT